MVRAFLIALASALLVAGAACAVQELVGTDVAKFYGEKMRGSLFAGFLGLGGFLLSLKTFILVKMKEELYGHPKYRERYETERTQDPKIALYSPLQSLKSLLLWAIASSLITAVLQMSLGLWEQKWAAIGCMSAAAFTIGLLLQGLFHINSNLNRWFLHLEEAYEEEARPKRK